jgi:tetratricopeptide (TPR) repeat protein
MDFLPVSHPHNPALESFLMEAEQHVQAGRNDAAVAAARRAIAVDDKDARAWKWMGLAEQQAGREDLAIAALEHSVALDDSDLELALTLAELQFRKGRIDAALSLAQFVLLEERNAPELRRRAHSLKQTLTRIGLPS